MEWDFRTLLHPSQMGSDSFLKRTYRNANIYFSIRGRGFINYTVNYFSFHNKPHGNDGVKLALERSGGLIGYVYFVFS